MKVTGAESARRELSLSDGRKITLSWAAITDVGRHRGHNEDAYLARAPIFAVADGMGGHAAGDFASATVISRLAEIAAPSSVDAAQIDAALTIATEDIYRVGELTVRGTGTTVTGIALSTKDNHPQWLVFNIGDSRSYLFTEQGLTRLTVDHSVVQELVTAGLISEEQAEEHPDSNVITRAVGFELNPKADLGSVTLVAGSRFLICSDGLTREISDARIAEVLQQQEEAADAAATLVDEALANQGRDNITVIVVDVEQLDEPVGSR